MALAVAGAEQHVRDGIAAQSGAKRRPASTVHLTLRIEVRIAGEKRQPEPSVTGTATEAAEPGAAAAAARSARRRQGWVILGVTAVLLMGLCAYTAFAVISTKNEVASSPCSNTAVFFG